MVCLSRKSVTEFNTGSAVQFITAIHVNRLMVVIKVECNRQRHGGFGSRQTLYSLGDPTQITTLVTWDSNEIYDAWRASPERAAAMAGAGELWSKAPESERFEVAD